MSQDVNIDFISNSGSQGAVAAAFATQGKMDVGRMRPFVGGDGNAYVSVFTGGDAKKPENYRNLQVNNGTLRRDEWIQLDEAVLSIAESRLNGIQSLVSRGLTYELGNGMGTTVLEYHDMSDALEADLSMDGVTRAENDRQEFKSVYLPIPIIHADYEINQRVLEVSRRMGNPLDTTLAERAARKVTEKLESMLFTNTQYKYGAGEIYSFLNFPQRNTDVTLPAAWDTPAVTGEDIVQDVLAMKQASIDEYHYGPWILYIPTGYETKMDEDYSTAKGSNTIRERILAISGIQDIVVVDKMPTNNVVLVNAQRETIRIVRGMGIQNVQWQTEGGFVNKFKVMTIQVPQIRADHEGRCGVIHATLA